MKICPIRGKSSPREDKTGDFYRASAFDLILRPRVTRKQNDPAQSVLATLVANDVR